MSAFIAILLVLVIGFGLILWFVRKEFQAFSDRQKGDQGLVMLNQNLQGVQERIDKTTQSINERLDRAAQVIGGVQKELGHVQEIGRHMKDLQDFLKSPKLRGNIGEQVLRDLLEQCFSKEHVAIQYKFNDGQIVDAIIKTDKGIIPIDSKFPLENFQRMMRAELEEERLSMKSEFLKDVKKHISDIAKKYILPAEGTVDFAVMYVPSEAVYYEIVRSDSDLDALANQKRVFIVSPNSFYYFLRVIMVGMEGKKIEAAAQKILETLNAIGQDATRFGDTLGVLTRHVTNAKNSIDAVNSEYAKLAGKIDQVRLLK